MNSMELMLCGHRLTTAEILYHLPDYPLLLQTYIWQEYDHSPEFPILQRFLHFWQRELDGKLHSVTITSAELIQPARLRIIKNEFHLH